LTNNRLAPPRIFAISFFAIYELSAGNNMPGQFSRIEHSAISDSLLPGKRTARSDFQFSARELRREECECVEFCRLKVHRTSVIIAVPVCLSVKIKAALRIPVIARLSAVGLLATTCLRPNHRHRSIMAANLTGNSQTWRF
jgi:hypothetical protein